jgi:predicted transcriptional regulator
MRKEVSGFIRFISAQESADVDSSIIQTSYHRMTVILSPEVFAELIDASTEKGSLNGIPRYQFQKLPPGLHRKPSTYPL